MKKRFAGAVLLLAVLTFGLTACKGNAMGEAVVYAGVHNIYLGEVKLKTDSGGKVTEVKFEEYFLPHHYSQKADSWGDALPAADLAADGAAQRAKFIKVGKAEFELQLNADGTVKKFAAWDISGRTSTAIPVYKQINGEKVPGSSGTVENLSQLLFANQQTAKWYVNELNAKTCGFTVLKADKSAAKNGGTAVDAKLYASGLKKTEGKYWAQSAAAALGWKGNIEKIEAAIKGNNAILLDAYAFALTDGEYKCGSLATGATATDFKDYWLLAQIAYKLATH